MLGITLKFTRKNEPMAFRIPEEDCLDPVGPVTFGLRECAMESGLPSVTIVVPLADGKFCVVETSFRLFEQSYRAMVGAQEGWRERPVE